MMRFGDLQRNASKILTMLTRTQEFAGLAESQQVRGIKVRPCGDLFLRDLTTYLIGDRGTGNIQQRGAGSDIDAARHAPSPRHQ